MSTPPTDYSEFCGADLRDLCRGRGLPARGTMPELRERLRADDRLQAASTNAPQPPAPPAVARLDDAERRLDIARRALDDAIQRAAARGDRDEVEVLHRDRRLLGVG